MSQLSERRKRKSKWDQITPESTGVTGARSSQDASVSAAAAAARLNAMLEAQGKLDRQMPLAKNTSFSSNSLAQASNLSIGMEGVTPVEIEINFSESRGTLTKGPVLNDINKATGAFISVRGRYMTPQEKNNNSSPLDKPLYLHVQGPNAAFVNAAVQRIRSIMYDADNPQTAMAPSPLLPNVFPNQSNAATTGHHYLQDKVFIGMGVDDVPDDFKLLDKLQGPGGTFLGHIASTTGAKVFLRGKGSGYLEPTSGRESFEALYVYLSHPKSDGLSAARKLCESLIEHVRQEFSNFQRSQMYHQPPVYQPGFNPYFQNSYNHIPQAPPVPLNVPPGYPPSFVPHPQITSHPQLPHPHQPHPQPPTPLMMGPQPPIIDGGGYYDNGGYHPPPPHPVYRGPHPPSVLHGVGPVPASPVPAGPVPSFPPPPLVGPEKPFAPEFVSEPVYTNESQHTVHAPHPANPLPNVTPKDSTLQHSDVENLSYHELPRNKSDSNEITSLTKRTFTEKSTTNTPQEPKAKETTKTRKFTKSVASNSLHTLTKPTTEVPSTSSHAADTNVENSKPSKEDKKTTFNSILMPPPPPSCNPKISSTMSPVSPRTNKRPSEKTMHTIEKKSKPFLSLVSYGEDSSEDSDS